MITSFLFFFGSGIQNQAYVKSDYKGTYTSLLARVVGLGLLSDDHSYPFARAWPLSMATLILSIPYAVSGKPKIHVTLLT